ncbi:MAG: sigma-70 family RNA polymerase sigma factor [Planctomyces sp.]|nr:sigma-70 family RNA polymerase sigma factor [Planctomyces sp.]
MPSDADPCPELLERAAGGDAGAMNALLDEHRQALRRMIDVRIDRRMSARVDASDVVQDVLLEASQRLPEYVRGPAIPFRIWLRQIAKDRMIDLHRRHRAQRRDVSREQALAVAPLGDRSSLDLAAQLFDSELTPAAATIRRELQRRFFLALDELPDDDREIILLRHVQHLGNSEAAQTLGLTPAAAGMRYLRALRRLRELLGETPSQRPA